MLRLWMFVFLFALCHVPFANCRIGDVPASGNQKGALRNLSGPQRKLFEFFTGGLTQIIWDDMRNVGELKLNSVCERSLLTTVDNLENGAEWAFRFVDASSKSPSGLLDGTMTSFGDYDMCLELESKGARPRFFGKHCMVGLRPDGKGLDRGNISKHLLERIPVFDFYYPKLGLCLPSTCRKSDIEQLVKKKLAGQPFVYNDEISCDTQASVSYTSRMKNISVTQMFAIGYLIAIIAIVNIGTSYEAFDFALNMFTGKVVEGYMPVPPFVKFTKHFSILKNSLQLITVKKSEARLNFIDGIKMNVILFGVIGNCISCFETPLGFYVAHRLHDVRDAFSSLIMQPFISLSPMSIVTFVGGFITLWTTFEAIQTGRFRFIAAIKSKWFKHLPSIISLLAMDFVWPLFGDGPMFTQVADAMLDKCTRNWWSNVLFVSNNRPAVDNCIPHTFYSSADLQLFVIGLLAVFLLAKVPSLGVIFSVTLAAIGNYVVFEKASQNVSSPVLFDSTTSVKNIASFMDTVHSPTYAHLSDYFIGLLLAFAMKKGISVSLGQGKAFLLLAVVTVLQTALLFSSALHNVYKLVPPNYYPHYIIAIKLFYTFLFLLYVSLYKSFESSESSSAMSESEEKVAANDADVSSDNATKKSADDLSSIIGEDMVISLPKAFVKIAFSVYMINYFYIRFDFFTTRLLYAINVYNILKRAIYSIIYSVMFGVAFHLLFVSPFENVRQSLNLRPIISEKQKSS